MFHKKSFSIILTTFLFTGCGGSSGVSTQISKEIKPIPENKISDKQPKDEPITIPNTKPVAKLVKSFTRESGSSSFIIPQVNDKENDNLTFTWKDGDNTISTEKNFNITNLKKGVHNLTFTVTDDKGASDTQTISITIIKANEKNDTPEAIDQNIETDEDNKVTFELNAYDAEGDTLTMHIVNSPSHGKLIGSYPYFTYTPDVDFRGSDKLSYTLNDGNSNSNKATIYIKVNTINDAPTVDAGKDKTIRIGDDTAISATAKDSDGDIVKYEWKEANILLSDKASFKYKPTTAGKHYLTLTVTDDEDATASDTMIVDVSNKLPLVVIRVEFNDFKFTNNAKTWSDKIFGTNEGQLNHFYKEISYGKLQFEKVTETQGTKNDGLITVNMDMNHPGTEAPFQTLLPKIIKKTDSYIDYSKYDINKNGFADIDELQVMFLFAGGEGATRQYPGVWAHAHCIYKAPELDNTKVMSCTHSTYSIFGERHKGYKNRVYDATIGIIAHELGHAALSLKDYYDTDKSSEGIGAFGLMGSGNWGRKSWEEKSGETPVHMIGWNKMQAKFIEPITIKDDTTNLKFIKASDNNYKLYKIPTQNENEYFLVENRDNSGYDRGLFSLKDGENFKGGLSIIHIDENKQNNDDETHKLADIEEANNAGLDKSLDDGGHRGDINNLYFSGNSDSFTPNSSPNSNLYDGSSSGINITNISDSGDIMSADITKEN